MNITAEQILSSPDFFPLKFEGPDLVFVKMSRKTYRDSIFTLPNRIVLDGDWQWRIPFNQVLELTESQVRGYSAPAFIFHPAHCGSTLLSRALDIESKTLAIRESFALRQFSASPPAQTPAGQKARQRGLNALLALLSRQYDKKERVILKANVPVNYVIDEINRSTGDTNLNGGLNGIVLFNSLDDYLLAILKSDERRQWALYVTKELQARIANTPSLASLDFNALNSAQASAVLWVSQMHEFSLALENNKGLRPIPSQDLYQQPAKTLSTACQILDLTVTPSMIEQIVTGELFRKHAKIPDREFSEATRLAERAQLYQAHKSEIESLKNWMSSNGLSIDATLAKV